MPAPEPAWLDIWMSRLAKPPPAFMFRTPVNRSGFLRGHLVIAVLLPLGAVTSLATACEVPTILALGDSITRGGPTYVGYRQVLVPALRGKGVAFRFIGPHRDETSAHAGYGGRNTAFLRSITKDLYRRYPADIVMLHSGHNSFQKDKPVPGIVRDTEAIIDQIHAINPQANILLAQVIPAGKLPKYAYIPELNRQLAALAKRLRSRDRPVILVDLARGFDWRTDTVADKVHPSSSGACKMTNGWMEALLPLLEKDK